MNDSSRDMMLIGYMRVSKVNGSQVLDIQRDALRGWKPDRPCRNLLYSSPRHLVNPVHDLTRHGASINTRTPEGQLVFSIFSALAEFEPTALISERTRVSLASAAHVDARAAVRTR